MNKMRTLKLLLGLTFLVNSVISFADMPPICPATATNLIVYAEKNSTGGWGAISNPLATPWENVFVDMYDTDINSEGAAVARAGQIQGTLTGSPVETKVYWDIYSHKGAYFYACSYAIAPTFVGTGDTISIYSQDYSAPGQPSPIDHTVEEKAARFLN